MEMEMEPNACAPSHYRNIGFACEWILNTYFAHEFQIGAPLLIWSEPQPNWWTILAVSQINGANLNLCEIHGEKIDKCNESFCPIEFFEAL